MKRKLLLYLFILVLLFPGAVYAASGESDANVSAAETNMACINNIRYRIINTANNEEDFKYTSAIAARDLTDGLFQAGDEPGTVRNGMIHTPNFYIGLLRDIKEDKNHKYGCNPFDGSNRNKINCMIKEFDDNQLWALAIEMANEDSDAVDNRFGIKKFGPGWMFQESAYGILYDYDFKYSDEKPYKFQYVVESTDYFCTVTKNSKKRFIGTGENWEHTGYNWKSCPVNEDIEKNVYYEKENVSIEWDYSNSRWNVTIPNLKGLQLNFIKREYDYDIIPEDSIFKNDFVHGLSKKDGGKSYNYDFNETYCKVNKNGTNCYANGSDGSRYGSVETKDAGGGKYTVIVHPNSGEDIFYIGAYYIDGGKCNGAAIYWHRLSIPEATENPYTALDSNGEPKYKKAYEECTSYVTDMKKLGYTAAFAYAIVPECNPNTTTISTDKIQNLYIGGVYKGETKVKEKINNAISAWSQKLGVLNEDGTNKETGNSECEFNLNADSSINKVTYEYTSLIFDNDDDPHKYWNARCYEKITINYLGPRALSTAGQSFTYPVEVTQERSCEPIQVAIPESKPLCSYGIECWGGPPYHHGEGGAGPNESFDSCISECDGGEYSQTCINKCYNETYLSKDVVLGLARYNAANLSRTKKVSGVEYKRPDQCVDDDIGQRYHLLTVINSTEKYYTTTLPISSCEIVTGNVNGGSSKTVCDDVACISEHGVKFTYLNGCNGRSTSDGVACFEVFRSDTDCLPVSYDGYRLKSAKGRFIPQNVWDSNQDMREFCKDRSETNCYKNFYFVDQVVSAEREYQDVLEAISVFTENPASQNNYFKILLNNDNGNEKEYEFKGEEYFNVMYKKVVGTDFSSQYDTKSLNMNPSLTDYSNYVLSETSSSAIAYTSLYGEHYNRNFYHRATGVDLGDNKTLTTVSLKRKYVFNLPNVIVDNGYTSQSNYNYDKAYTYKTNTNNDDLVYDNSFVSLTPDKDGINYIEVMTVDDVDYYTWKYYADNGGVARLKTAANSLGKDVSFSNIKFMYTLGTWSQAKNRNLTCFYGIPECTDPNCLPVDDNPPGGGGLTYIFRPIELKNVFPCTGQDNCTKNIRQLDQRNARYNWTDEARADFYSSDLGKLNKKGSYNYSVNPNQTQDMIEKNGEDVYEAANELDYDIVLTKKDIKEIRSYNKTSNYGDYSSMNCYFDSTSKLNICESDLLRNKLNIITNKEHQILGCNNQSGSDCLDLGGKY